MSKVFTITEGLENMGAMKTGGQGSVYKGRRVGEIITAIKLLPTPIIDQDGSDKNYCDFMNEVEKLKRVNEEPHPHVVTILTSGVSDTGNFPFIEMEYIEGPDLEDLLKPPHDPVFSVKDTCKVAEHLSNALAHCHKYGVKHGDIKSNNVKFNVNTGNYVLLDFGLSVMSDEQRRTSLRNAGAIEFMAPEQNEGQILFQTDVYSFGVILFELIAGRVPFPLNDKSESSRNIVRVSHMETEVPDMLQLRYQNMPASWTEEKKALEMMVPGWLVETVYRCLQKDPSKRFADGVQLHDHILHVRNSSSSTGNENLASQVALLKQANMQLQDDVASLQQQLVSKEQQLSMAGGVSMATTQYNEEEATPVYVNRRSVSRSTFMLVVFLAVAFAAIAAYAFFSKSNAPQDAGMYATATDSLDTLMGENLTDKDNQPGSMVTTQQQEDNEQQQILTDTQQVKKAQPVAEAKTDSAETAEKADTAQQGSEQAQSPAQKPVAAKYKVQSKAYFHTQPAADSRTNEYIIPGNVVVRALDDRGDFILINFRDDQGETTRGWINKKDLGRLN